ncbi:hypothetical protein ACXR2U_15380 [Jatrophihabitans sp. YIM 134969]
MRRTVSVGGTTGRAIGGATVGTTGSANDGATDGVTGTVVGDPAATVTGAPRPTAPHLGPTSGRR